MKFTVHYTEKGDGQKMSSGKIYNGSRRMDVTAKDEASAVKKLKSLYVKDGIKEIKRVDLIEH